MQRHARCGVVAILDDNVDLNPWADRRHLSPEDRGIGQGWGDHMQATAEPMCVKVDGDIEAIEGVAHHGREHQVGMKRIMPRHKLVEPQQLHLCGTVGQAHLVEVA